MFDQVTLKLNVDPLILSALREDITSDDVSTNSIMKKPQAGEVDLICKQDGIICGLQVFERVFTLLDDTTKVEFFAEDGEEVKKGQLLAKVYGDIRVLLSGERTALNYLQRMSGIATYTHSVAAGADIIMLDNMDHEQLKEAMDYIAGRAEVEVSGNVTKENISRLTDLGVDFISSGALTHSAPIMDISLKNLHAV